LASPPSVLFRWRDGGGGAWASGLAGGVGRAKSRGGEIQKKAARGIVLSPPGLFPVPEESSNRRQQRKQRIKTSDAAFYLCFLCFLLFFLFGFEI
jgi:hypothetical protein